MHLRDHHRESRIFGSRVIVAVIVVLLMALILISRMTWLQVFEHARYATLSEKNRVQTRFVSPPRGLLLDRHGRLLAENQPAFSLAIVPEQMARESDIFEQLGQLIDITPEQVERFEKRRLSPRRPWEPIPLRSRLSETEIAILAANQHRFPAIRIEAELIRHYPDDALFSHVVGYVNRINADDLAQMTQQEQENYVNTHYYGRIGLEQYYEHRLHGQVGQQQVETNARGRILKVLEEQLPTPGEDLTLYLDYRVQKAAWDALGERRGAVIAIDPRNGGVLAFVSRPGFDPNLFVTGISHQDYSHYRESKDIPLFNRALQGQYPPGSTIKPHMGLAALHHGTTDWQHRIRDKGYYQLPNDDHRYRDWKKEGHGIVDLHTAVVQSCDTYFYELAYTLGIDRIHEFMTHFSLGTHTGIDLLGERTGIMPSRQWKRAARNDAWYHGDTINVGIGQGFMLATPLQLAVATAVVARRGEYVLPTLAVTRGPTPSHPPLILRNPADWDKMHQAMEDVVHGLRGTARIVGRNAAYRIAGKTGTAQVFSVAQDEEYNEEEVAERLKDHALFVAYAPADNPAIAVAVIVENGSHGGSTAGPVARATLDAWLLDEQGQFRIPPAEVTPPTLSPDAHAGVPR